MSSTVRSMCAAVSSAPRSADWPSGSCVSWDLSASMVMLSTEPEVKKERKGSSDKDEEEDEECSELASLKEEEEVEESEWERKEVLGPGRSRQGASKVVAVAAAAFTTAVSVGERSGRLGYPEEDEEQEEERGEPGTEATRASVGVVGAEKGTTTSSATDGGEEEEARS